MSKKTATQDKKSNSREYYYSDVPWGNYESSDEPIVVNCADFNDKTGVFSTVSRTGRADVSICYIAEGELFFSLGGDGRRILEAGTVAVVLPHTPMNYGIERELSVRRTYWLHFTGSYAMALLNSCGLGEGGYFRLPDESGLTAAFTDLLDEMRHPPTQIKRIRAAALAVMLLTQIGTLLERGNKARRLPKSIAYIREHFTEDIDKSSLAAMDGLGASQYHSLFKKVMGETPASYITSLRMRKARELLLDPDLPIAEVAEQCGYDDALYFSRVFRRTVGVSPSKYRLRGAD